MRNGMKWILLVFIIAGMMLFATAAADSSGTCGNDLTWVLDSEGILTISGTGPMNDYYNLSNVPWYNERANITGVVFDDTVTKVGYNAFNCCANLTSVHLPENLATIGGYAFNLCTGLTGITLPESLAAMSENAFSYCSTLTEITIPGGVTSIGGYAFSYCSGLTSVTIENGITGIGDNMFSNCSALAEISIPVSVTSISNSAFTSCSNLHDIFYTGMGYEWYQISGASSASFMNGKTIHCADINLPVGAHGSSGGGVYWYLENSGHLIITGTGSMRDYSFSTTPPWYGRDITKVSINSGVTTIGSMAFINCSNLSEITIPEGITAIGEQAFANCTSLTEIDLPESLTYIGPSAFSYCTGLTEVTIPASVNNIIIPFEGASNLTAIQISGESDALSTENGVLYNKEKTTLITYPAAKADTVFQIPESVTSIASYAFEYASNLTSVIIPDGVRAIGPYAFTLCRGLTEITLPAALSTVSKNTFSYCTSLASVNIPSGMESIDSKAFYYCNALTDVYFAGSESEWNAISIAADNDPLNSATLHCAETSGTVASGSCGNSLTWTLDDAGLLTISGTGNMTDFQMNGAPWFEYNSSILAARIKEGVTSIGNYAFISLSSLAELSLPETLTRIGAWSVNGCRSLTSIAIPANVAVIGPNAFSSNFRLTEFRADPENAYYSDVDGVLFNKNITTLICFPAGREGTYTIPDTVTTLLNHSFCRAQKLTAVEIPSGVTGIGEHAFQFCNKLTDLTIPEGVTSLGEFTFSSCSRLESITLPASLTAIGMNVFNYTNLTDVYYGGSQIRWNQISIAENNQPLLNATIHCAAENRVLNLPADLITIESQAFVNLPEVEAIRIPASVTGISADAFDPTVILIVPNEQWAQWAEDNEYDWQLSESGTGDAN